MEVLISDLNAIEGKGSNSPGGIIEGQISSFSLTSLKAMAPHSSTLAWKIPWMEETGRLQSMGSPRVGHDWSNLAVSSSSSSKMVSSDPSFLVFMHLCGPFPHCTMMMTGLCDSHLVAKVRICHLLGWNTKDTMTSASLSLCLSLFLSLSLWKEAAWDKTQAACELAHIMRNRDILKTTRGNWVPRTIVMWGREISQRCIFQPKWRLQLQSGHQLAWNLMSDTKTELLDSWTSFRSWSS